MAIGENCKISEDVSLPENVKLGSNVVISKGAIIYDNVEIGSNTFIGPHCIIGEPVMQYYSNCEEHRFNRTVIGSDSIIRSHSVIYENVRVGNRFQSGHRITIREESEIGDNCSVGTMSDLQGKLRMGNFVRLHSNVHIAQYTLIEDYVWIYPYAITTNDPYPPMGRLVGAVIRAFAQIATASVIMPGIEVGRNALVGAKTLVNRDVGEERVVVGVPCKDICSVRDIKDKDGNTIYPWKEHVTDFRGYPWQIK